MTDCAMRASRSNNVSPETKECSSSACVPFRRAGQVSEPVLARRRVRS